MVLIFLYPTNPFFSTT